MDNSHESYSKSKIGINIKWAKLDISYKYK